MHLYAIISALARFNHFLVSCHWIYVERLRLLYPWVHHQEAWRLVEFCLLLPWCIQLQRGREGSGHHIQAFPLVSLSKDC
jgi:ligand-binding sensor domain-containing protein